MSEETKARWLAKLDHNISHGDIRESNSALKVAASLDALSQRDQLAEKYALPLGVDAGVRILSPSEIAQKMDASIPGGESRIESEEKVWPNPPILSCPPLVLLDGYAAGTGDTAVPS